jgi:hypothetical protein
VTEAAAEIAPRPPKKPVVVWDLVVTIVVLLIALVIDLVVSYAAVFLVFASDSCGSTSSDCNSDAITFGVIFGLVAPSIVFLLALVASIILLVRRKITFWVPIAAIVLEIGTLVIAGAIVFAGASG